MHSSGIACGYDVYNLFETLGFIQANTVVQGGAVHNRSFMPTLVNSFNTQFCTQVFNFCICIVTFIHPFHMPYNNHFLFKETNL